VISIANAANEHQLSQTWTTQQYIKPK